ncbi:YXWGXW repeat-containing protein [Pendulispora albinea]|uniref:YXWGXW repeat-containing protein n=1 Tax=Pendulispora albinea TaxID=2741071 RepID=A0ABZ2M864_9BACT
MRERCTHGGEGAGLVVLRLFLLMFLAGVSVACGYARHPRPPYVRQTSEALVEVPYPPPPAKVEFIPDSPREGAVWIDGEWAWHARRWAWRSGRWVIPASGTAFSPRAVIRNGAGTLFAAEGRWRDVQSGNEVPAPPALALAKASPGEVVDPEGDSTTTGQDLAPQGADAGAPTPVDPPPGDPRAR